MTLTIGHASQAMALLNAGSGKHTRYNLKFKLKTQFKMPNNVLFK